jgi:hypothetical protein
MNLQENISRIKEVMNIHEQIPDSRFAPKGVNTDLKSLQNRVGTLPSLTLDDTIDIISAVIDGVPGLGNLISAGIDVTHAISYIVRFFYSNNDDEKVEYATLAIITLGISLMPVAGNTIPIIARKGVKEVLRKTPDEILLKAKKLGLYNKTVFLFSKEKWYYNKLLVLAKIFKGELLELLTLVSKYLKEIYTKTKNNFKNISNIVLNFTNLVDELIKDSEIAIKLINLNAI